MKKKASCKERKLKVLGSQLRDVCADLATENINLKNQKKYIKKLKSRKKKILNKLEALVTNSIDKPFVSYVGNLLNIEEYLEKESTKGINALDNKLEELNSNIFSSLDKLRGTLRQLQEKKAISNDY